MMMTPAALIARGRAAVDVVTTCPVCDHQRRPRMWICSYHAGWLDALDAVRSVNEGGR